MLGFLNLFTAMSLCGSMEPQATIKQIQNTKFILNFILLTTFKKWNTHKSIQPETCFEKL